MFYTAVYGTNNPKTNRTVIDTSEICKLIPEGSHLSLRKSDGTIIDLMTGLVIVIKDKDIQVSDKGKMENAGVKFIPLVKEEPKAV